MGNMPKAPLFWLLLPKLLRKNKFIPVLITASNDAVRVVNAIPGSHDTDISALEFCHYLILKVVIGDADRIKRGSKNHYGIEGGILIKGKEDVDPKVSSHASPSRSLHR
ncbi:hypothetical protein HYFRA_00014101 [Hymenoscyphus fraxineus]|uniref:Uncharacterized protein n=1 Tax=Hymenoscyphus fraxineus TaxID=746836 RepID=A0A9N9L9L8_9HELO|nr:hypothetical protein HYFRA_00014101 [Hymenoscyphus fraxineus]